jgi:hypothetical protein
LADQLGIAPAQINDPIQETRKTQGAEIYEKSLLAAWQDMDTERSNPKGIKGVLQKGIIALANYLPATVLIGGYLIVLWDFSMKQNPPTLFQTIFPALLTLIVILILQFFVQIFLPFNWSSVRERFRDAIRKRLAGDMTSAFNEIPANVAKTVLKEREKTEAMLKSTQEVSSWLAGRENAAAVQELYGKTT